MSKRSKRRRITRSSKSLAKKRNQEKTGKHNYEALEPRQVLSAVPMGISDRLYFTDIGQELNSATSVLANDFDPDSTNLTAQIVSGPAENPSFNLNPDGTFSYLPNGAFEGVDSFVYQVADSDGNLSRETEAFITVGDGLSPQLNQQELIGSNYLHTGALEYIQSLGGGFDLVYDSNTIADPIIVVETLLAPGTAAPDAGISVALEFGGEPVETVQYAVGAFDFNDVIRFSQSVDTSGLSTGLYDWTMTVTLEYSSSADKTFSFSGEQALVDRSNSEFGAGWWLSGLDRLHVQTDGVLLENSDGTTHWFENNGNGYDQSTGDLSYSTLDFDGGIYTLTDKWGDYQRFDSNGYLTEVGRRNNTVGPDFTFTYNTDDTIETITDQFGRTNNFAYDGGFLDSFNDFANRDSDVTISSGLLQSVVVADEAATANYPTYVAPEWQFTYQTIGGDSLLEDVIDPDSVTTTYSFGSTSQRLTLITFADGDGDGSNEDWHLHSSVAEGFAVGTATLFAAVDSDARYIDERGQTFRFETDGFGNVIYFQDAENAETVSEFSEYGELLRVTAADPDGDAAAEYESPITQYGYDTDGNVVLIVQPDGKTQTGDYDGYGNVETWTDELGFAENFRYDSVGNLQYYWDAEGSDISNGSKWVYTYDSYGNLNSESTPDPDGESLFGAGGPQKRTVTTYVFDHPTIHNRLMQIEISEAGGVSEIIQEFEYSAADQVVESRDALGNLTEFVFDPLDRLVKLTLPNPGDGSHASPVYEYQYDANLQISLETDPLGNTTSYTYNDRHWLETTTLADPDGSGPLNSPVYEYDYYENGLVKNEYRPEFINGNKITHAYDNNGNLESTTGPLTGQVTTYEFDDLGRLESQTDAYGLTATFKYDVRSRVTAVISADPNGPDPEVSFTYLDNGWLETETNELGHTTTYTYYDNGLLESTELPNLNPGLDSNGFPNSGPVYTNTYDDANRLIETTDPAGRVTNNYYDFRHRLVKVEAPDPNPEDSTPERPTTVYDYDVASRLESTTDPLGRQTDYSYDDLNRLTEVLSPAPETGAIRPEYRYKYDAVGNHIETIDPVNRKTTHAYDNLYRPTTLTNPDGQSSGRVQSRGRVFSLSSSLSAAQSNDWVVTYNDQLQIASITDPESTTTTRGYDDIGRLISSNDPLGNETSYTYDLLNRTATVTLPDPDAPGSGQDESVTTYVYDAFSRIASITDEAGTTSQSYDLAGNLINLTDASNNTTYWSYDALGRKTHETDQLGFTASFLYNSVDRLVRQSNKNGDVTWFTNNHYTRSERWFEYDGTLPTITNTTTQQGGGGTNETQTVTLNDLNDGAFRLAFGGSTTGNIDYNISAEQLEDKLETLPGIESGDLEVTGGSGVFDIVFSGSLAGIDVPQLLGDVLPESDGTEIRTLDFEFDAGGRLLSTADYDSNLVDLSSNYSFLYDDLDRVTDQTENIVGLTPEILLQYGYDRVGRRTNLNATLGGVSDFQNTYQYDALDRPWQITQQDTAGGNDVAYKRTKFVYNHLGDVTYINRYESTSNSVGLRTVLTYDGANRLDTLTHRANIQSTAPVLHSYDFDFDNRGRIDEIVSSIDGTSSFTFDEINQLTNASHASIANENYIYDATGNRDDSSYEVGLNNQTESDGTYDYEYDGEGNRIQRTQIANGDYDLYEFDHRNRLTQIASFDSGGSLLESIDYTYDVYNRLIHRSHDNNGDGVSNVDDFFAGFDGDNPTLHFQVTDNADAEASDLQHRFLWGPFIDMLMAEEDVTSLNSEGQVLWTLTDHLGTVRDIGKFNNGAGEFEIVNHRIYNSFGEFDSETDFNYSLDFGFTGKWTDPETGMTHHLHRWYDPATGKWISEDPIGFAAGDSNISRYVGNNPLQFTDPNGLMAVSYTDVDGDAGHGNTSLKSPGDPSDDAKVSPKVGTVKKVKPGPVIENNKKEADKARKANNTDAADGYLAENEVIKDRKKKFINGSFDIEVEAGTIKTGKATIKFKKDVETEIDVLTTDEVIEVKRGIRLPSENQMKAQIAFAHEHGKKYVLVYDPNKIAKDKVKTFVDKWDGKHGVDVDSEPWDFSKKKKLDPKAKK